MVRLDLGHHLPAPAGLFLVERSDKEVFDEEKTGWGWKMVVKIEADQTVLPTTCKMERPK